MINLRILCEDEYGVYLEQVDSGVVFGPFSRDREDESNESIIARMEHNINAYFDAKEAREQLTREAQEWGEY